MNACRALLGMHAFTECDTVSALAGRGKLGLDPEAIDW